MACPCPQRLALAASLRLFQKSVSKRTGGDDGSVEWGVGWGGVGGVFGGGTE